MNDKELLEAAARAAGIEIEQRYEEPAKFRGLLLKAWKAPNAPAFWNPLTNDGDALRLAVKLGLQITPYPIYTEPKHSVLVRKALLPGDDDESRSVEIIAPYAAGAPESATRRAIVRTAAAIGSLHNATLNGPQGPNER